MSSYFSRSRMRQVANSLIRKWSALLARVLNSKFVLLTCRLMNMFLDILICDIFFQATGALLCMTFEGSSSILSILNSLQNLFYSACFLDVHCLNVIKWLETIRIKWDIMTLKKWIFRSSMHASNKSLFHPEKVTFGRGRYFWRGRIYYNTSISHQK